MEQPEVLIAEDETPLRALLADVLIERGLRVVQARDGVEAFERLKQNPGIALLLSDIKMPRKDGYALVEDALDYNPELKILLMTAFAAEPPPSSALRAREIKTLAKPFDVERMCDMVADMLSRP